MKFGVIGAGAIGSLIAGYLTKAGEDVLLVGRSDQVEAVNTNGLLIKSAEGEEVIPVKAAKALDQEYDLVIFTVKTPDLEQAYQDNHAFLEHCLVLTTQNGVQGDNLLSGHFDRDKMLSSIVMFGGTYLSPGEVTYNFPGDWIIGKPYTPVNEKVWEISEILGKAFKVVVSTEIIGMKWVKLFVNFNNCIPALVGKSMQETFADIDLCRLSVRLLKEGLTLVKEAEIELVSLPTFPVERIEGLAGMPEEQASGIIQKTMTGLSKEPLYGSILQSIKRQKPSEIDFINGEVNAMALSMRRESPLNTKVVDMVHQVENTNKFFTPEEIKKEFSL